MGNEVTGAGESGRPSLRGVGTTTVTSAGDAEHEELVW